MDEIQKEVVKTRDIKKTLELYASENFIPLNECDFKILSVITSIKGNADTDYVVMKNDLLKEYLKKDRIINEHISFIQNYNVEIFHQKECQLKLEYTINYAQYATHPKIILSPKSHIPYKLFQPKELLNLLFKEINKIKASHKILINIFDEEMRIKLKSFIKYIYAGKFVKKIQLPLFDGIDPLITQESKLIFYFEEKDTHSAVIEVDEDETLIKFIKPIFGHNGFNAFGEEISAGNANNQGDLKADIDENSIYIDEDEHSRKYKSKRKGYVHYTPKKLSVDNKIKVAKLSRNNARLAEEEENNIEVIISQKDSAEDSIGEGVTLTSETIHVNGFVGANSTLEALHLTIDGATHQDSKQFAKHAKINRHKGTLRCHNAQIGLLEGGEVHASDVTIESSIGGNIYAKNVTIGHIKSNLKIHASESITIKLISGEDNLLHITHENIPILSAELKFIAKDIDDLKFHLEEASRHNKNKVPEIKKQINKLLQRKKAILESYKSARISISEPLRGLNKIVFSIDKETELSYKTDAQKYTDFYIECTQETITLHPVGVSLSLQNTSN